MAEIPPGEAALPAASKITIDDESDDTESDATPAEIKAKIERDVDELFKTKTVEEMEEIEKKLRRDVETADAEISRTIGGSWKDFMENSKDIDLITSNLQEIVDGFAVVLRLAPHEGAREQLLLIGHLRSLERLLVRVELLHLSAHLRLGDLVADTEVEQRGDLGERLEPRDLLERSHSRERL